MYGVNLSIRAAGDLAQRIVLPEDFKKMGSSLLFYYCKLSKKLKGDHFQAMKIFKK